MNPSPKYFTYSAGIEPRTIGIGEVLYLVLTPLLQCAATILSPAMTSRFRPRVGIDSHFLSHFQSNNLQDNS